MKGKPASVGRSNEGRLGQVSRKFMPFEHSNPSYQSVIDVQKEICLYNLSRCAFTTWVESAIWLVI